MAQSEVTQLLTAAAGGDPAANDRLIPLIYDELRAMAGAQMAGERVGHTLRPTELVAEAYLRLCGREASFQNRAHFFGAASSAMRRVLVDHARARAAQKRGGGAVPVTLDELVPAAEPDLDVLALNEALNELETEDPRLARVVELRFFVGLSIEETADTLGVSKTTVKRDWTFARAWLFDRLRED